MAIVTTDDKHYKAIADALRNQGGSDSYTPEEMANAITECANQRYSDGYSKGNDDGYGQGWSEGYSDGEQRGCDYGRYAEYSDFWDTYQNNGKASRYTAAFRGYRWTDDIYNPKYPIICSNEGAMYSADACFAYSKLTDIKVPFVCEPTISITVASVFYDAKNLVNIPELRVSKFLAYSGWFGNCSALTNMMVTGTIGKNGFNVRWSAKLTHDSLMSIINALEDKSTYTGTTEWVVTLGSTNLAKLTDTEKAIATEKGWTLA